MDLIFFVLFRHWLVTNKKRGGFLTIATSLNHHPLYAIALKERAAEVRAEAIVYAPGIGIINESGKDYVAFALEKFNL